MEDIETFNLNENVSQTCPLQGLVLLQHLNSVFKINVN
jgi:hypothetical protein